MPDGSDDVTYLRIEGLAPDDFAGCEPVEDKDALDAVADRAFAVLVQEFDHADDLTGVVPVRHPEHDPHLPDDLYGDPEPELATDGGRPAFWAVRVHSGGYAQTFQHFECKFCEATDEDDPANVDHAADCRVNEQWVEEQYRLVTAIDGVGESTATTLLAKFGSAEAIAEFVAEIPKDDSFAPVRIVDLDGFGPDTARTFVENAHDSDLLDTNQTDNEEPEVATDGGSRIDRLDSTPAAERPDAWGPHECPYDEDYHWWKAGEKLFWQGHRIRAVCETCGEGMACSDSIEGRDFVLTCDCSRRVDRITGDGSYERSVSLTVSPTDSRPTSWLYHVQTYGEAEIQTDGEVWRVTATIDGDERTYTLLSETLLPESTADTAEVTD